MVFTRTTAAPNSITSAMQAVGNRWLIREMAVNYGTVSRIAGGVAWYVITPRKASAVVYAKVLTCRFSAVSGVGYRNLLRYTTAKVSSAAQAAIWAGSAAVDSIKPKTVQPKKISQTPEVKRVMRRSWRVSSGRG